MEFIFPSRQQPLPAKETVGPLLQDGTSDGATESFGVSPTTVPQEDEGSDPCLCAREDACDSLLVIGHLFLEIHIAKRLCEALVPFSAFGPFYIGAA